MAFLTVLHGTELSTASVRKALAAKVPTFMIPSRVAIVDAIPRAANGKPDQRRLIEEYTASGRGALNEWL